MGLFRRWYSCIDNDFYYNEIGRCFIDFFLNGLKLEFGEFSGLEFNLFVFDLFEMKIIIIYGVMSFVFFFL